MLFEAWLRQCTHSLWRDKSFALTVVLTMGIASGVTSGGGAAVSANAAMAAARCSICYNCTC
jgi:hypothetical protein